MKSRGYIHAELMAQYAEDAKSQAEPWKMWQCKGDDEVWRYCCVHPMWASDTEYRRKPKTHIVHGVEIPVLRFKPKYGQEYWSPAPSIDALVWGTIRVYESSIDTHRVANNLCYEPSEEGKQAAILHAKAMLGIAEKSIMHAKVNGSLFDRLSAERQELVERIANLEIFMHSNAFADQTPTSQGLLMVQLEAMRMYATTLERRIEIS